MTQPGSASGQARGAFIRHSGLACARRKSRMGVEEVARCPSAFTGATCVDSACRSRSLIIGRERCGAALAAVRVYA